MSCPDPAECLQRIARLEATQDAHTNTLTRIDSKLDKIDAKISNGLSTKVSGLSAHLRYVWAILVILVSGLLATAWKASAEEVPIAVDQTLLAKQVDAIRAGLEQETRVQAGLLDNGTVGVSADINPNADKSWLGRNWGWLAAGAGVAVLLIADDNGQDLIDDIRGKDDRKREKKKRHTPALQNAGHVFIVEGEGHNVNLPAEAVDSNGTYVYLNGKDISFDATDREEAPAPAP